MCRFLYFGQGENIDHIIPMLCRTKMLVKAYKLSHTISPNGLNGRYFSFTGNAPWQFHELSERDTDFSSTLLHKQGQELRSEQTVIHIHEQNPSTYFLHLNNSETFVDRAFWAQRWRARTVPWPQIFNSWKFPVHSGLHFSNSCEFSKWSCWGSVCRGETPPSAVADRAAA